jgi:hypothetical protein
MDAIQWTLAILAGFLALLSILLFAVEAHDIAARFGSLRQPGDTNKANKRDYR